MSRRTKSTSVGEFSRLSMPSASKIARTPLTGRKHGGIPMSSVKASTSKNRTSYMGTSEHHMKDTRPIHDKPYMRKCIMEIVKYLNENGFPATITPKMLSPPSNRDYYRFVEFVYQQIDLKYVIKPGQKPDEEIAKLYRILCYPFTTSKSTWSNVGIMSSWPHALAALDWLLDLVKYTKEMQQNELVNLQLDENDTKEIRYEYYKRSYIEFMNGKDAPYAELNSEFDKRIGAMNSEKLQNVDALRKMDQELQDELETLLAEKDEVENIKELHKEKLETKQKLEKYYIDVDQYCGQLQDQVKVHDDSIENCNNQSSELRTEITRLKSIISQQDLSTKDIEIMNKENNQITSSIESLQARNKKLESEIWEAEIEMAKIVDKINVQVVECNENSNVLNLRSINELVSPDDIVLAHGHAGISDNTRKLNKIIQPAMRELANSSWDEIGKLQQEHNNLVSKKDQLSEQLEDYKEKHKNMKLELEKLNKDYLALQSEIATQEESLKCDTEHVKEELERIKMVNEVSVEDMEQMLSEQKISLKNKKDSCKQEKEEKMKYVKDMFVKATEQRERCDQDLNNFRQHMLCNAQKLKDVEKKHNKILCERDNLNSSCSGDMPTQQIQRVKDHDKETFANITSD